MPIAVLAIITILGGILTMMGFWSADFEGSRLAPILAGISVSALSVVWRCSAKNQDFLVEQYHYVDTIITSNGETTYNVYPKFFNDKLVIIDVKSNSGLKVALPPNSIAKVWKYDKWKMGINWQNDELVHCEIFTPSDPEYKNVKSKAIKRFLKEN